MASRLSQSRPVTLCRRRVLRSTAAPSRGAARHTRMIEGKDGRMMLDDCMFSVPFAKFFCLSKRCAVSRPVCWGENGLLTHPQDLALARCCAAQNSRNCSEARKLQQTDPACLQPGPDTRTRVRERHRRHPIGVERGVAWLGLTAAARRLAVDTTKVTELQVGGGRSAGTDPSRAALASWSPCAWLSVLPVRVQVPDEKGEGHGEHDGEVPQQVVVAQNTPLVEQLQHCQVGVVGAHAGARVGRVARFAAGRRLQRSSVAEVTSLQPCAASDVPMPCSLGRAAKFFCHDFMLTLSKLSGKGSVYGAMEGFYSL
jgi:hypothetical protein